ncbi:MAG: hypothetical protein KIS76_00560 [Pyrinomonadaceae bacterium]|nr:hypothetical protein [Pyrinomonadaceae bacterium]
MDSFTAGNPLGYALYCEDNAYGKAAAIGMDIGRSAGIAGIILGGTAGRVPGGRPFNPFKGKTPQQIEDMFLGKGYIPKGPDPLNGRGTYMNPRSGRGYHIDAKHPPPKGPHVGVHRPRGIRKNRKARDFSL